VRGLEVVAARNISIHGEDGVAYALVALESGWSRNCREKRFR